MTTTTITKSWTGRTGKTITVTGELVTEKEIWLDGDKDTIPCCEMSLDVTVDGNSQGDWVRKLTPAELKQAPAGYTHRVGQLGLTAENVAVIKGVRGEIEAHPAWVAKQQKIAENERQLAQINKARRQNGYCSKCHSYCDGDCEA
jgi:hypothetical protein